MRWWCFTIALFTCAVTASLDAARGVRAEQSASDAASISLRQALIDAARRDGIPPPVIDEFIKAQALILDIDQPSGADNLFKLLHSGEQLLAGALTFHGETDRFYRFATSDGAIDYYDECGKSLRSALLRRPVLTGVLQSGFGMVTHPILGVTKMHTGVDWAAPSGTEIVAAGNGVVEQAGWNAEYGNYLRVQHAGGYESAYAHLLKFAPDVTDGARVRQGEVIAYVGSTGTSSGPHLHYEILINGRFVDPLRIRLPHVRVLEGSGLADFERERDRLDTALADSQAHALPTNTTPRRDP